MKKLISILLVITMLCAMSVPAAFATTDVTNGTQVLYNPADPDGIPDSGDEIDNESYFITVPAALTPGSGGIVTLHGTWASNRIITVTAERSVELTNNLTGGNKKTLTVEFHGIKEAGSNTAPQTFTETVSVSQIEDALFGKWTGHFYYQVSIDDLITGVAGKPDVEKNETPIPVNASDANGNDLNATSYEIIGSDKEDLLNKLADANLIFPGTEVDALIEVDSDEFTDLAATTFDVSNIANTGDKVIILHFDETRQEWEFISEEIVNDDGKVTTDFSSYSPVAFVVIKADGTQEIIISQSPVLFGKYYALNGNPVLQEGNNNGNPTITHAIGYSFYADGSWKSYWEDGSTTTGEPGELTYVRNILFFDNELPLGTVSPDGKTLTTLMGQTMTMVESDMLHYEETYSYRYINDDGEWDSIDVVMHANGTMDVTVDGETGTMPFTTVGNQVRIDGDLFYVHNNGEALVGKYMTFGLPNINVNIRYEKAYSYEMQGVKVSMIPHANGTYDVVVGGDVQDSDSFKLVGNLIFIGDGNDDAAIITSDGKIITLFDRGYAYLHVVAE